jgi:hypothetical protein
MEDRMTVNTPQKPAEAVELSDSDLDGVSGAGPISDTAGSIGKAIGSSLETTKDFAVKAANKVGEVAKDAAGAGGAFVEGLGEGMGGGDNEGGGDTGGGSQEQR